MAKDQKKDQKEDRAEELLGRFEDPEAIQQGISKTQELIEKNKVAIVGVVVLLVAGIVGLITFNSYQQGNEQEAQVELFPAVFYLEKDSLEKALEGDFNKTDGLKAVKEKHSGTKAAALATYYKGIAHLKEEEYDEAIAAFEAFNPGDYLVQARTYCLIGDCYMQKEAFDQAISYYRKAADYKPNEQFTPYYLLKLGAALQAKGDTESAAKAYQQLIDDYPMAIEVERAKKFLAALS